MSSESGNISILKKYFWIFAGIASLLINLFFSKFPSITETIYSNFVFQAIRYLYDYTLGFIPFPMVYVLFCGLIFLIFRHLKYLFSKSYTFSITKTLVKIASIIGFIITSFYVLWGFNYARIPFHEKQGMDVIEVDSNYVKSALLHCKAKIESSYPAINYQEINYGELEKEVRATLQKTLIKMGYKAGARVRGRLLKPKGTLLRISTAGVYIPFVAEGHIDGGLHPSQWPFTLAHEMSHAYGFGDEGTCNFIALIACAESDNKFIQYSGWMGYFRYLASNYRRINNEEYLKLRAKIDPLVIADINAVNANLDKYPDIMPDLRDFIYGSYLKSQGVQGGLQSYSNIIKMMAAWEKKHGIL